VTEFHDYNPWREAITYLKENDSQKGISIEKFNSALIHKFKNSRINPKVLIESVLADLVMTGKVYSFSVKINHARHILGIRKNGNTMA